jgi:hypothetical protein
MGHKERMKKNKGLQLILLCFLVICSATRANAGWRVVIDLKTTKAVATNAASQKVIEINITNVWTPFLPNSRN